MLLDRNANNGAIALHPQLPFKSITLAGLLLPPISPSPSGQPLSLYSWSSVLPSSPFAFPVSSPSSTVWNPARSVSMTYGDRASPAATGAQATGRDMLVTSRHRAAVEALGHGRPSRSMGLLRLILSSATYTRWLTCPSPRHEEL
jgi:hypothetical protein